MCEKRSAADPGDKEAQDDLAHSYANLGDVLSSTGQSAAARQHYEQALALREKLRAADPGYKERQSALTLVYDDLGDLFLKEGQLEKARQRYEQTLTVDEKLRAADPSAPERQLTLLMSHTRLLLLSVRMGQGAAAHRHQTAAIAIVNYLNEEKLFARDPILLYAVKKLAETAKLVH